MAPGTRTLVAALCCAAAACDDAPPPAPAAPPGPAAQAAPLASSAAADLARAAFERGTAAPGALEGLVLYAGVSPARVAINTAAQGGCGLDPAEPALTETWVVDGGRLANVFVWLEDPPPSAPETVPAAAREPVTMRQRGCVYRPHAVAVRTGETLLVSNEDRARHNVRAIPRRNPEFNHSQDEGAPPLELAFAEPEVAIALVCDLHPWMKAWIGVFDHPYCAVTGADGRFAWTGLPAGEYRVRAWHEALGKLAGTAVVGREAGARLALVYPPKD